MDDTSSIEYSLSEDDIRNYFKRNGVNVLVTDYPKLKGVKDLDQICKPYCVCLVLADPNYGHWTMLSKLKSGVYEFFDPYGKYIDSSYKEVPADLRKRLGEGYPFVSDLFAKKSDQGKTITYNEFKVQKLKEGVNTCGKHVCVRAMYDNYMNKPLESYIKMLKENGNDTDEVVNEIYKN